MPRVLRGAPSRLLLCTPPEPLACSEMRAACSAQAAVLEWVVRGDRSETTSRNLYKAPEGVSPELWQYEHLRLLCCELTEVVVRLQGICTPESCPTMCATTEWQFLCAAHREPRECPAIEYMIHTLDGSASLLCNQKLFPSRSRVSADSARYFESVSRRLYRILAHTFYHHPDVFGDIEEGSGLCSRFCAYCEVFRILPQSMRLIPENALYQGR